jgi:transcriptional regulator with XRE-family HTH domain
LSMSKLIFLYNFFMFNIRLKELRLEKGLTQKKLAEKLQYDQSMIARWEKGECEPTESAIRKTAIFFEVSADYLLGLEDETGTKYNNSFNNFHNSGNINIR